MAWLALTGLLMPIGILTEVYFGAPPVFVLIGAMAMTASVIWLGISFFKMKTQTISKKVKLNKMTNAIGIEKDKVEQLAPKLNVLLAHYFIFYQNTRGYHWNIKGDKFFELHLKFEELYNELCLKIDAVADHILTLGYFPELIIRNTVNPQPLKKVM